MSGLARILVQRGFAVTGTDPSPDEGTLRRLRELGVAVATQQDGSAVPDDAQLLIASAALPQNHPELVSARSRGIPIVKYAEMLGALFNAADGLAVAGTHGKTTTTAMAVSALSAAGVDAGFVVGGLVPGLGASASAGSSPTFVAEACEYDRSFLNLSPKRAIVTNIDDDHLDIYGNLDGVRRAFAEFVSRIDPDGAFVYCADSADLAALAAARNGRSISYSATGAPADFEARNIRPEGDRTVFDVYRRGTFALSTSIRLPGLHNVGNALAALAATADLGHPLEILAAGIAEFRGAARRFQTLGEVRGAVFIDDYGHHPTEIRALLAGARQRYADRRIVAVFQPHQIARTNLLFGALAASFEDADIVVLTDIYAARDAAATADTRSAAPLAEAVRAHGKKVLHAPTLEDATNAVCATVAPGDVVLTIGAGDVHKVGTGALSKLTAASK